MNFEEKVGRDQNGAVLVGRVFEICVLSSDCGGGLRYDLYRRISQSWKRGNFEMGVCVKVVEVRLTIDQSEASGNDNSEPSE